jgi:hypothetical protein
MSALARQTDQAARRLTAERVRAAGRFRRAEAGSLTEMARSLLRDAREAGDTAAGRGRSEAGRAQRAAAQRGAGRGDGRLRRACPPGRPADFRSRSLAAPRA